MNVDLTSQMARDSAPLRKRCGLPWSSLGALHDRRGAGKHADDGQEVPMDPPRLAAGWNLGEDFAGLEAPRSVAGLDDAQ